VSARAALAGIGLLLAAAVPAGAQAPEVVVGAGSYNEAPVIGPGRYTDSIRASETNIYAIDLAPGQQLSAEVGLDQRNFEGLGSIVSLLVDVDGPGRTPPEDGGKELLGSLASAGRGAGVTVTGPVAQDPVEALETEEFPAAGRWYVRVSIDDPNGEAARVEFPMTLMIDDLGEPTAEAEPPIVTEPPDPPPDEEADGGEDDSSDAGTLVLVALCGALVGGAGALARGNKLRRNGG
jgi:hypothetical protein